MRIALTIAALLVLSNPAQASEKTITDMHVHLACVRIPNAEGEGCYISPEMMKSFKLGIYLKALNVTLDEMRATQNAAVADKLAEKLRQSKFIRRAVVLGMDGAMDRQTGKLDFNETQVYVPNSFVLREVKRHPDVFLYGPSINPYRKDALARLEQAKRDGAVLIKWIPSTMNIDPGDPRLVPFYQKLRELKLPLLTHTGAEKTFVSADDPLCDPNRLKLPLDQGVTIIAAHLATIGEEHGEAHFERLRKLFLEERYKSLLYADISGNTMYHRIGTFLKLLKDPAFQGRLVYGSDWPLIEAKIIGIPLAPFWLYATPLFGSRLSWSQARELSSLPNRFDRDVLLKKMLGVPEGVFHKWDELRVDR